ncbi:MAG: APC family permease, partial [Blautia sp.]|nr:APC family permease [Blautia sp.]
MDEQKNGFARYLSRLDVGALSLSCIIGWGAFVMPGTTFLPMAGPIGTMIAIFISTLTMCVIGMSYYYLMVKNPGIGGVYAYSKRELGRGHAFLSAWFLCLSYLVLIPQNATAFALVCRTLFRDVLEQGVHYRIAGYDLYLREWAVAVFTLAVIGILAIYAKPFLQQLQTALALLMLFGVAAIALLILCRIPLQDILKVPGFGQANPAIAVFSIIVLAPWAFVGFEVISLETAHFQFPILHSKR